MDAQTHEQETVLVVDPCPETRALARELLAAYGYGAMETEDGEAALATLTDGSVHLVIVDLGAPVVDGLSLLREMQRRGLDVPVVVMVEEASVADASQAVAEGAANVLAKPFGEDAFCGAVAGAMLAARRRLRRARGGPPPPTSTPEGERTAPDDVPAQESTGGPGPAAAPAESAPVLPIPDLGEARKPLSPEMTSVIEEVRAHLRVGNMNLPMVPSVMRELRRVMDDPRHRVQQLASIVEQDQELAVKVLQRANSAAYAGFATISNVPNALVRIGGRSVMGLALRTMTERACRGIRNPALVDLALRLWRRTVVVASAARLIAIRARHTEPEDHYLAALLADLGEPFLVRVIDDLIREKGMQANLEAVRREIGLYHCELGAALLRRWQIEQTSVQIARHHHDRLTMREFLERDLRLGLLVYTLALARVVAEKMSVPLAARPPEHRDVTAGECLRVLRLRESDVADVMQELAAEEEYITTTQPPSRSLSAA